MKRIATALLAMCVAAGPLLAEEVLHCTDTGSAGLQWKNGNVGSANRYAQERFTVKVMSDTQRLIQVPNVTGGPFLYLCEKSKGDAVACFMADKVVSYRPFIFQGDRFERVVNFGPDLKGAADGDLLIAYGRCTKS